MNRELIGWALPLFFFCFLSAPFAHAQDSTEIDQILSSLQNGPQDTASRLDRATEKFVGKPYLENGPLGEGPDGRYDQDPLFRTDGFDCTTFVETTLALARTHDFPGFFHELMKIRYQDGKVDYVTRNHFVELDWNPNNIAAGFFTDATLVSGPASDQAVAVQTFSKREWYQKKKASDLKILSPNSIDLVQLLADFHREGEVFPDITSRLPYLRKESLRGLENSLPVPSVLNIVKDVKIDGQTQTMVTHQVLLLEVNGKRRIRQASSRSGVMKVTDSSYSDYLDYLLTPPSPQAATILRGVNVLQVNLPVAESEQRLTTLP